jgi:uncharacterized protein YqeY
MSLYKQLKDDIISSMKNNDGKLLTLRDLDSKIQLISKENKVDINDVLVINVIKTSIKQRKQSIDAFEKGNRQDLVDKEQQELYILESYLPPAISAEELENIVKEAIGVNNASTMKDMGKVMKYIIEKTAGCADNSKISKMVREHLN